MYPHPTNTINQIFTQFKPSVDRRALPKWYQELVPQYLILAGECDRLFDKFSIAFQVFFAEKPSNLAQSQI